MLCPKCGRDETGNPVFCRGCGWRLGAPVGEPPGSELASNSKKTQTAEGPMSSGNKEVRRQGTARRPESWGTAIMSGLAAGVILGLSALYGGRPGYLAWLVSWIFFLGWLRPFNRVIAAILISLVLGVLISNWPLLLSKESAKQISVQAMLEDHGGTPAVKVTLEGGPKGSPYIVRLTKSTEYTDWYEEKSVTSEDLRDGSETVWFPMSVSGNVGETEAPSVDSVKVEVVKRSTGITAYFTYLHPQPEEVQVIPNAQRSDVGLDGIWPTRGHDSQRSGCSPFAGPEKPHLLWKEPGGMDATALVGPDGTVYLGCSAWNPDGSLEWVFKATGDELAIAADGTIYFGGEWCIYALSPEGGLRWILPTDGQPYMMAPAISSDGTIYAATASYDNRADMTCHLYSIAPDGTLKWDFSACGQILSSPALGTDGTILFITQFPEQLYALNPDGGLKWTYPGVCGDIAVSIDGTIYVACGDLYAFNPDGSLKWQNSDIQGATTLAVDRDGSLYIGTYDGKVQALAADGHIKWSFATKGGQVQQPAIDCNGTVYVGADRDDNLYALDSMGGLKWKFDMGFPMQHPVAIGSNGTIYTNTGHALGPES